MRVAEFMRIFDEAAHKSAYQLLYECGAVCNLTCLGLFVIICYTSLKPIASSHFPLLSEFPCFMNENRGFVARMLNIPSNYTKGWEMGCFISICFQEHDPNSPNFLIIDAFGTHHSLVGSPLKYFGTKPKAVSSKDEYAVKKNMFLGFQHPPFLPRPSTV